MKKIICLYGQPGCGKTTQAELLAKNKHFFIFGMGETLRAEISSGSELGEKIRPYVEGGTLIPDEYMEQVISNVGEKSGESNIVFDGFPRIAPQALMLEKVAAEMNAEIEAFFYLRLTAEEALARIKARGVATGRHDDIDPEAVKNRFAVFEKESVPLLELFRERGKLVEIDGAKSIEEVYSEIEKNII
jgi:adenylate kinase